jgi:hypothetical protein
MDLWRPLSYNGVGKPDDALHEISSGKNGHLSRTNVRELDIFLTCKYLADGVQTKVVERQLTTQSRASQS